MSTVLVVAILGGILLLYGVIAVIVVKYPDSSFSKIMGNIIPSFIKNMGVKPVVTPSPSSPVVTPPPTPPPSSPTGATPSPPPPPTSSSGSFAGIKNYAQCPIWKSAFAQNSYDLSNINPASLDKGSPNVKAVANFCGLGNTIVSSCTNTKDTLGITDPSFPNSSTGVYGYLCKSLPCTLNNSQFINMEWDIASGSDANVSSVFEKDGTLKFNIYSVEDNGNVINAFCDTGRQILADKNCSPDMTNYVTNSAAFKFFCCNSSTCSTSDTCASVCTPSASQCLIDKGHFANASYNIQNFNPGSLDAGNNLQMMEDYCAFGDSLISNNCAVDQYHPNYASTHPAGWCDANPASPSCLYNKWCVGKSNQCLSSIGKFNPGQWTYQGMAYDTAIKPTANYNPISSLADCGSASNFTTPEEYLASCKLSSNGQMLVDFCNNANYIASNGCDKTSRIDMTDKNAMNYPPVAKSITYLTNCCGLGLGDPNVCNVDNSKMIAAYTSVRDKNTLDPANHNRNTVSADFFSFFGNDYSPQK